jgi:hypothetical protein
MNFQQEGGDGADMDPRDAAAYARGESSGAAEGADGLSGGMDSGGGFPGSGGDGPMRRLFDGDADGPSTGELEAEYGLERWQSVFGRGILRTATGTGVPPVAEILLGGIMGVAKNRGGADAVEDTTAALGQQQGQPAGDDVGGQGL